MFEHEFTLPEDFVVLRESMKKTEQMYMTRRMDASLDTTKYRKHIPFSAKWHK
jgi:hypothetical protein